MQVMSTKNMVVECDEPKNSLDNVLNEVATTVSVIAQEVKIVQALACNDLNKRNRQLKKLRIWLSLRAKSSFPFTEEDFSRIWKGLYYTMWLSDKPLVQEELAETLGQLVDCFNNVNLSIQFFGAFLRIMRIQWFGIDQWRMDKFLMLMRRMLRYMFRALKRTDWDNDTLLAFNEQMKKSVLHNDMSTGLAMHFLDIFFEELAKVSEGNISAEQVGVFIKPFVWFISVQRDSKLISHCRTRVFNHLLYQSALGRQYMEKYNAWRQMGFPTKSIDDLEKVETDLVADEEHDGGDSQAGDKGQNSGTLKYLDPRAGNVDVLMPELPLDGKFVIDELNLLLKKESYAKCRKMLRRLLQHFETYQSGTFPLGIKTVPRFEQKSDKPLIKQKIEQLDDLENELFSTVRKLKKLNKRKRRKLLKSIDYENLDESNFEQVIEKELLKARRKKKMPPGVWLEEELDAIPEKKKVAELELNNEAQTNECAKKDENEAKITCESKIKKKNKPKKFKKSAVDTGVLSKKKLIKKQNTDKTPTPWVQTGPSTSQNSQLTTTLESKAAENVEKQIQVQNAGREVKIHNAKKEKPAETEECEAGKKTPPANTAALEWNKPLAEGELEYFLPSIKQRKRAYSMDLDRNPFIDSDESTRTPKTMRLSKLDVPKITSSVKRVQIKLQNNTVQNPNEYIKQLKSSPMLPYDANKKPGKGLLKPTAVPSPINPFYMYKIGLNLGANDSP